MKAAIILGALLLSTPIWAQSRIGPGGPDPAGPPPIKLSSAEEKAVTADLQVFQKQIQDWDQEKKTLDDQRRQLLDQDKPGRADFETILRAQQDLAIKQELARFDLEMQWRQTYGAEKAPALPARDRPRLPENDPASA